MIKLNLHVFVKLTIIGMIKGLLILIYKTKFIYFISSHNCTSIQTDINTNPSWLYYKQPLAASSESEKIIFVTGNEATITLGTLNIKKADFKSFGFRVRIN